MNTHCATVLDTKIYNDSFKSYCIFFMGTMAFFTVLINGGTTKALLQVRSNECYKCQMPRLPSSCHPCSLVEKPVLFHKNALYFLLYNSQAATRRGQCRGGWLCRTAALSRACSIAHNAHINLTRGAWASLATHECRSGWSAVVLWMYQAHILHTHIHMYICTHHPHVQGLGFMSYTTEQLATLQVRARRLS